MLPMSLRLPSISSNIQIIASFLPSWITRSLTLIDSSSDFCSGLLGLVACFFSFWLYLSLCFPPPFDLQTISTIASSPSLVTSVQLTVLPLATKYTWTPESTSVSSLALLPLDQSRASLPSVSNSPRTTLASPPVVTLASLSPRLGASLFGARILGTRFLIFIEPTDTHDNDA